MATKPSLGRTQKLVEAFQRGLRLYVVVEPSGIQNHTLSAGHSTKLLAGNPGSVRYEYEPSELPSALAF